MYFTDELNFIQANSIVNNVVWSRVNRVETVFKTTHYNTFQYTINVCVMQQYNSYNLLI